MPGKKNEQYKHNSNKSSNNNKSDINNNNALHIITHVMTALERNNKIIHQLAHIYVYIYTFMHMCVLQKAACKLKKTQVN